MSSIYSKITSFFSVFVIVTSLASAQDAAVTRQLQSKYGSAQWHSECNGWYLVSYNQNNTNFYAFADNKGNIIVSNAVKYKIYKGYIEMQVFDQLKKAEHDNWEKQMRQYQNDYNKYISKKKEYENAVDAYNTNVAAAKKEAESRWNRARQYAYDQAVAQAKYQNQQAQAQMKSNTSVLAAVLVGVASGVNVALAGQNAANKVEYKPFENTVLAERNLLTAPAEPYNPRPTKPVEPSDGYEWKTFPLLQPCPYSQLDYSAISDPNGHTKAYKNNQYWGVVDASLNEVIPCIYSDVSPSGNAYVVTKDGKCGLRDLNGRKLAPEIYSSITYKDEMYVVKENNKYGLLSKDGSVIVPCLFELLKQTNGYIVCKKDGLWGVYTKSYEELYPCQFQEEEFVKVDNTLLLRAKVKGLWGLIDFNSGRPLIPFNFTQINPIKLGDNQAFSVRREGKSGIYYSNGVLLLPCEFSSINTVAIKGVSYLETKNGNLVGLYDLNGACIIPSGKYDTYSLQNDFFFVTSGNGNGVCSLYGDELVPPVYSSIEYVKDLSGFLVRKDGRCGVVDIRGNLAFPMIEASSIQYYTYMPNVLVLSNGEKSNAAVTEDGTVIAEPKFKMKQLSGRVSAYEKKNDIAQIHRDKTTERAKLYDDYLTAMSVEKSRRETFSFYAQNYVERIVNDWQKKGEFEKMSDWQIRVNEGTRQQKVYALTKEAQDNYLAANIKHLPKDYPHIVGKYDPDNETYQIKTNYSDNNILVHVPTIDAEEFKSSFSELKSSANFQIKNDGIALSEYAFIMPGGNVYTYKSQDNVTYSVAQVDYDFEDIDLGNLSKKFSTSSMKFGTSDVDVNIPTTQKVRDNMFVVIIANENYVKEKNVEFAYNDGMAFKDYCVKAMGIPADNVHFKSDAGLNDMRFEFNWMKKVAEDYKGEASFILYYAGHGLPDDATKEAYLLPVDGNGEDLESSYKLSSLYSMLGKIPAKDVIVFMDACFSGAQRNGEVLASARGVAIKPQIDAPTGNVVVFSAVSNKETAYPYKDKIHGLFTYYLLKKIQSTNGDLDLGSLSDYVSDEVARKSIVVNKKSQHPTISAAPSMTGKWRQLNVK